MVSGHTRQGDMVSKELHDLKLLVRLQEEYDAIVVAVAKGIVVVETVLFFSFGLNQWLQYRKVGRWSDYLFGEKTYLVLSLVATMMNAGSPGVPRAKKSSNPIDDLVEYEGVIGAPTYGKAVLIA